MDNNNDINNIGFKLVMKYRNVIFGLATIWIFVFHTWIPVFNNPTNSFTLVIHYIEEYIRKIGYCGVDIFLLLSGMGLTYAIKKGSLGRFYYRRIRRVFLPYLAAGLICWPINHWSIWEFLGNVSGYTFFTKHIHTFGWFVPAIVTLYLFFPLYYKFFSKVKSKFLFTVLSLTLWFLLSILLCDHIRFDLYGFTNRIPVFIIGIYFGEVSQRPEEIKFTKKHYLALIALLAAGLFLAYMYNFRDFEIIIPGGKALLPNILLSVSLSFLTAKLMEIFDRRTPRLGKVLNALASFWGNMSLEMYCAYICFLVPFFGIFVNVLAEITVARLPINLVIFSITSGISWIECLLFKYFWELVELPGKRKKVDNIRNEQQSVT
jgi:hypothetical protein